MPITSPESKEPRRAPSVFLSYASEDREAVQVLRARLPALGLEVWYDDDQLTGGDAWDQKIRRQIRECDFFMPVISARTEARHEGYFRREWRLAVERTLDMADDHLFLLPVVIDETDQTGARVPERFLTVQWLRLPGGQPTPALEALCRRIVSGQPVQPQPPGRAPDQPHTAGRPSAPMGSYPEFPREEAGQRVRFWAHVAGWTLQSAWITFKRFPRWIRILISVWLCVALLSRGCVPSGGDHDRARNKKTGSAHVVTTLSPATASKLKEIADDYKGSSNPADITKLGMQIARQFGGEVDDESPQNALLVIPFNAPTGDSAAQRLADSTFAMVYGRIAVSHHGHVGLADTPLSALDSSLAVERGRARHSQYVLYGAVDKQEPAPMLTVKIATVSDGSLLWSQSYPVAEANPEKIAADVDSKVPRLQEE